MALTTGRALPNQLPSILDGRGLLLGRGVRAMSIVCSTCAITGNRICLHTNAGDREGYCIDCGEEYQLDALNLDLRCADCVEQWALDTEGASV